VNEKCLSQIAQTTNLQESKNRDNPRKTKNTRKVGTGITPDSVNRGEEIKGEKYTIVTNF